MQLSVELALTPLQTNYKKHIIDFIKAVRNSEFKLKETPLSTQIYSIFEALMPFLNTAIKQSFKNQYTVLLNMKLVKGNRSNYESNF